MVQYANDTVSPPLQTPCEWLELCVSPLQGPVSEVGLAKLDPLRRKKITVEMIGFLVAFRISCLLLSKASRRCQFLARSFPSVLPPLFQYHPVVRKGFQLPLFRKPVLRNRENKKLFQVVTM